MNKEFSSGFDISTAPLHDITQELGTKGLLERFEIEIQTLDKETQEKLKKALELVAETHKDDERSTEPYINHLLRVFLRIKKHFEISDPDILCAALLHDSVEDHASDITGNENLDTETNKQLALEIIEALFGSRTSELVGAVTNPEFSENRDIMETQYLEHLEELVNAEDSDPIIIKLSDFIDNAGGIHYSRGPKLKKWASKYLPIVDILERGLQRPDLKLNPDVKIHLQEQLDRTRQRLLGVLNESN